jgi:peptide/nickel transport system substrate-binding protein
MRKLFKYTSLLLLVVVLMVASCGTPAAPPEEPPAPSAEEPTAPAAEEPTAAPEEPAEGDIPTGGTVVMGMWEDPGVNLNPYFGFTIHYWMAPALERLIGRDPNGDPYPVLAKEIPTLDNGGVSEDGLTITYNLRDGVKWADGEDFTCDDVAFTFEAVKNPNNQVGSRLGYNSVDTVECPDDLTAVIKFSEFYAPWMTLPLFVVPEHVLGGLDSWNDAEWNQMLMGTGAFYVTENVSGDHVTFEKNPYYWQEGKPYIDQFIIRYFPSREAGLALLEAGEIDVFYDLTEADMAPLLDKEGLAVYNAQGNSMERLILNLSVPTGDNHGNPEYPHPFLGDLKVRQAIELAIDKQAIVDDLLYGLATVATSEYPKGWASDPTLEPSEFNPEKSMSMLKEAGWIDEDGDGIRECHGCLYAEEGTKAELSLNTTTLKLRELVGSLIVQNLGDVGIKLNFETQTATELWGIWDEGGRGTQGTFDIQMWTDFTPIDPQDSMYNKYHSSQIPLSATECGACWNYGRFANDEFDQLMDENAVNPDTEARKANFQKVWRLMQEQVPVIYLYNRGQISVLNDYVKGYLGPWDEADPFEYLTTYVMDFYIEK